MVRMIQAGQEIDLAVPVTLSPGSEVTSYTAVLLLEATVLPAVTVDIEVSDTEPLEGGGVSEIVVVGFTIPSDAEAGQLYALRIGGLNTNGDLVDRTDVPVGCVDTLNATVASEVEKIPRVGLTHRYTNHDLGESADVEITVPD